MPANGEASAILTLRVPLLRLRLRGGVGLDHMRMGLGTRLRRRNESGDHAEALVQGAHAGSELCQITTHASRLGGNPFLRGTLLP